MIGNGGGSAAGGGVGGGGFVRGICTMVEPQGCVCPEHATCPAQPRAALERVPDCPERATRHKGACHPAFSSRPLPPPKGDTLTLQPLEKPLPPQRRHSDSLRGPRPRRPGRPRGADGGAGRAHKALDLPGVEGGGRGGRGPACGRTGRGQMPLRGWWRDGEEGITESRGPGLRQPLRRCVPAARRVWYKGLANGAAPAPNAKPRRAVR